MRTWNGSEPLPPDLRVGDLVTQRVGGTVRILRADPRILIHLTLCEQLLFRPNRYARIEIQNTCDERCKPGSHPCTERPPLRLVHFSDDYGSSYVYALGQHWNMNGIESFEACWPD